MAGAGAGAATGVAGSEVGAGAGAVLAGIFKVSPTLIFVVVNLLSLVIAVTVVP